jgi:transforming growth factor-beta-induced protein
MANVSDEKQDIRFDGGYIHLIDTVLTPPATVETTAYYEGIQNLILNLERPGVDLLDTVEDAQDVTIFAPTDGAFDDADGALSGLNGDGLRSALTYHVAKGVGYSTDFRTGQAIPTLNGKTLSVEVTNGTTYINGARIIKTDLITKNGVIHIIDRYIVLESENWRDANIRRVLLPPP